MKGLAIALIFGTVAASSGAVLHEADRLGERRVVVTGDRMYQVGAADGTYPPMGWHIRGEMGGFWSPPIKLLDGVWFAVDGTWLRATRFTSAPGHTAMTLAGAGGLKVERVDVVPDGGRAALIGLRFPPGAGRMRLTVEAHSEVLTAYPWSSSTPSQSVTNRPDAGAFDGRNLIFRERAGTALVGSGLTPTGHALGPGMRGPQGDDDGPDGKGTGGRLDYEVRGGRTVWFAVAGSDRGDGPARAELTRALRDPAAALAAKTVTRREVAGRSRVDLPGDRLLQQSRVVQAEPRRLRAGVP